MAVNRVQRADGTVELDVTGVTAAAEDVAAGKKFVGADGVLIDGSMPSVTQATPSITVSSAGLITASATQEAGAVAAGTKSATKQLTVQAAKTVTPTTTEQVAVAAGVYTTGAVKVAAVVNDDLTVAVKVAQAALDAAYNNRSDVAAAKAEYDQFTAELAGSAITVARANIIKANVPVRITATISAFDIAAAASVTDTVVQGEYTSSSTTSHTISGLSFTKIKTVFIGANKLTSLGYNWRMAYLLYDGSAIAHIYYNSYWYTVNGSGATFTYSNGTLTITSSYSMPNGYVYRYTIIGE